MRKTLVQFALLAIVLVAGYVALFKRDEFMALVGKVKKEVQGYKEAKTPNDALEYVNKALEDRNYSIVADYLAGEYGVQLRKVADKASKLAKALDDFKYAMEHHNVKSPKVTALLSELEPFAKHLKVSDVKQKGDNDAVAVVDAESGILNGAPPTARNLLIPLKRENDQWKLALPLTPAARAKFELYDKYGQDYVNALNVVKNRLKTDATTKENVFNDLEEEIKKATKE